MVTWPLDRSVSAEAGSDGALLTTIPIRHRGGRLEINAAVLPGGQITVELLDAASRPLARFPPSEPFTGDDLRHVVRFAGQTGVSATADKPMVLGFAMKNAELYSFAFRDKPFVALSGKLQPDNTTVLFLEWIAPPNGQTPKAKVRPAKNKSLSLREWAASIDSRYPCT